MKVTLNPTQTGVIAIFSILAFFFCSTATWAVDIGPMTWTPKADWVNVKNPSAIPALAGYVAAAGNGTTDDTAALQAMLTYIQYHGGTYSTLYFPAGTYKITGTLSLANVGGFSFIGCGSNTIISWAGPAGGAMYAPDNTSNMRYIGLVWEGNNTAAVAYEEDSQGNYAGAIRHENESFHDFTAPATYSYLINSSGGTSTTPTPPTGAIVSGYTTNPPSYTGETQIWNCRFYNCTEGVAESWNTGNFFCWFIDDSEFDNCGTAIDFHGSAGNVVTSCHFQGSTVADILGGFDDHIRHCTSTGSAYFFSDPSAQSDPIDWNVIEDCWVDSWTNPAYAINFFRAGPNTVFDCTFTTPPSGASSPIASQTVNVENHLLLSNNYAAGLSAGTPLINSSGQPALIDLVPPGLRFGALTLKSASQTFLNTSYPAESTSVIDISQGSYRNQWTYPNQNGFAGQGLPDITAALQSAINQAQTNNNGTIVYIPTGIYNLSSTITCTGGNYVIEGNGFDSEICWFGADNMSMFSVNSPKITIQNLRLGILDATIPGITATASSAATMTFDGIHFTSFQAGNPGAGGAGFNGLGLVLSNLPATSTVYIPLLDAPLTVQNCGGAQILTKYLAQSGATTVSGTTPQTGFLGTIFTEGGQGNSGDYDVTVTDNQDLIFGDYYVEQDNNNILLSRGSGTVTNGRVTIGGINTAAGNNNGGSGSQYLVNVNNYEGRVFYGSGGLLNWDGQYPVSIYQTGTNPIDMIFAATAPLGGINFSLGSSANLISTLNVRQDPYPNDVAATPNPLTATDYLSIAQSLDHFRQLEAVDLSVQNGLSTDGPAIAQYPFEGNVLDMTGVYNGTAHNVTYDPGLGAQAATFNGTTSYVQINNPVSASFSIAMWLYTTDTALTGLWYKGHGLVDGYTAVNANDFGTSLNGGKFSFGVGKSDTTLTSTTAVNDGNWHHLVATRNSTTGAMQIYIDGALNNSVTGPTGTKNAATVLRIGDLKSGVSGSFYKGTLDQVQIFNYALSATDVANLYHRTQSLLPNLSGDLATGFNLNSDSTVNGWCYGTYSTANTPSTFNIPGTLYEGGGGGMATWYFPPAGQQTDPNVEKNIGSTPVYGPGIEWLPGTVSFGPYSGPAVARYKAPATGHYSITASFQTDQIRGTQTSDGTTGSVYVGSSSVFSQVLMDPGAAQFGTVASYSATNVALTAGETVDFVVGGGAFTTQVGATVTQTGP